MNLGRVIDEMPRTRDVSAALRVVEHVTERWNALQSLERGRSVGQIPWARLAPIRAYAERLAQELERVHARALADISDGSEAITPLAELRRCSCNWMTTSTRCREC